MAPQLSNFCGFSLKHGTIIIGVLESILAFMALILCAAYADNPHELINMSDPSIIPDLDVLKSLLIIFATAAAFQCVFAILLIFGAETNRPLLLLPWLLYKPIVLITYIISLMIAISQHSAVDNHAFIFGHLIVGAAILLIAIYNYIAVHSLFKHLKSLNF